jgi:hypothetical protein
MSDVLVYLKQSGHVVAAVTRRAGNSERALGDIVPDVLSTRLFLSETGTDKWLDFRVPVDALDVAHGTVPSGDLTRLVSIGIDQGEVVPLKSPLGLTLRLGGTNANPNSKLTITAPGAGDAAVAVLRRQQDPGTGQRFYGAADQINLADGSITVGPSNPNYDRALVLVRGFAPKLAT